MFEYKEMIDALEAIVKIWEILAIIGGAFLGLISWQWRLHVIRGRRLSNIENQQKVIIETLDRQTKDITVTKNEMSQYVVDLNGVTTQISGIMSDSSNKFVNKIDFKERIDELQKTLGGQITNLGNNLFDLAARRQ